MKRIKGLCPDFDRCKVPNKQCKHIAPHILGTACKASGCGVIKNFYTGPCRPLKDLILKYLLLKK